MNKKYIVSCANWQIISKGKDAEDAATQAFEKMIRAEGKNLQVSTVIETLCLSDIEEDFDLEQYTELTFCPRVMSNAGFHESAKTLNELIENEDI